MSLQNHIIMICSSKKVFDNLRIMIKIISRLVTSKMVRRRLASFCIMLCMFGYFRPLGYSSKAKADWKLDCLACPEESPRRMYVPAVYSWICSQRFYCTLINRNKYEKADVVRRLYYYYSLSFILL